MLRGRVVGDVMSVWRGGAARRRLGAWAAAVWLALGVGGAPAAGAAPTGGLTVEDFFKDPAFSGAQLSPDGKKVAVVAKSETQTDVLVMDLATGVTTTALTTSVKGFDFVWLSWKSDTRLIVGSSFLKLFTKGNKPDGEVYDFAFNRMILAVDIDGKKQTVLLNPDKDKPIKSGKVVRLMDILEKDPAHVLAVADDARGRPAAWKVDVATGAAEVVETATPYTYAWYTDVDGRIVARLEARGSNLIIQGRAPGATEWTEVMRLRAKDFDKEMDDFEIMGPGETPGTLLVAVKPKEGSGGKARTLHIYDLKARSLGPPVWPALDYDIEHVVQDPDTGALEGVCYWVDTYTCDFKDKAVEKTLRTLAKYFKGDRNLAPISYSRDGKTWLLVVSGPNETATYYLYDWDKHQVSPMMARFPNLPTERLGAAERFSFKASDGMTIPGYLTRPPGAGAGPLPMVVMPHGGPEARDYFDFDLTAQVLAAQGYLVFQPNFRGSSGYGVAFAEAGYGQWGGRMQADITDGVRALIAQGRADPNRICIVGASYGGYAALMGGAQNPDLYKCVVSRAGVSDLVKIMQFERGMGGGETSERFLYWQKSIGDPEKDKAKLQAASPITYAKDYKPPVLLLHGEWDVTVPDWQSKDMQVALRKSGHEATLKLYKFEGHSGWDDKNEKAALTEIITFLKANIPPGP